ncbi:MAG TPA: TrkH family potassium uptake protein [Bacteroidales bacterium]|nr:TrkH family potassium uptake protein [Bacteroidales bacterium]HPI84865.1 TrkH family potassium uptake protein [Bacteroidales bacterium]HPM92526.1 TrkH family potassium uptake protein [Bacteroidales bacterium]
MFGKSEINFRQILRLIGVILVIEGVFMLTGLPFSLYYQDDKPFTLLYSFIITSASGGILLFFTRSDKDNTINKREGFLVVSLAWVVMSLFGTVPFLLSGAIPSFTDAFFETMSGFTTTGASILSDVEVLPKGILFWRSMTHWIGGMGIIVLTIIILPFLGIGGMQLYVAEMPGVSKDKLHPKISETAKRLWGIYIVLTAIQTILLVLGKMPLLDSLCHAFGSMATGGFSTRNASIGAYSPYIQYVVIVFMFLAGMNFTLHYFIISGRFKEVWKNEEFRKYLYISLGFSIIIAAFLVIKTDAGYAKAFRDALFQVVSIVTTTGYATTDYLVWPGALWFFIFLMMFVGGMAGSTGGGVKVVRQLLLFKNAGKELKRAIHPQGVIPVRLNHEAVSQDVIYKVMAFFQLYIIVFIFGAMILSFLGLDFESAIGASISALGNIGPGLGLVGPVGNYGFVPDAGKWLLSFMMLLGRLELFTVLLLITPYFWKR